MAYWNLEDIKLSDLNEDKDRVALFKEEYNILNERIMHLVKLHNTWLAIAFTGAAVVFAFFLQSGNPCTGFFISLAIILMGLVHGICSSDWAITQFYPRAIFLEILLGYSLYYKPSTKEIAENNKQDNDLEQFSRKVQSLLNEKEKTIEKFWQEIQEEEVTHPYYYRGFLEIFNYGFAPWKRGWGFFAGLGVLLILVLLISRP